MTLLVQEIEGFATTYHCSTGVTMLILNVKNQNVTPAFAMDLDLARQIAKHLINLPDPSVSRNVPGPL